MRLLTAEVDRYGPLRDWRPPCREGLTVLTGPNEAGKTLYLEALLQLLDPAVVDVMDPPPRVDGGPTGRVVVERGGEQYELDGDACLGDVCSIDPTHLQTVFVVRDNDLGLPGDREYYASLVERLGDIHTTEIDAISSALKARGRLTEKTLKVSSDRSVDDAGEVRDRARALAADVRAYAETMEADGLDELDARRLRRKRVLRDARQELEGQRAARRVADYEYLSGQLAAYRAANERLADLAGFDRATLDELRRLRADLDRDRADLSSIGAEIEDVEAEVEALTERLADDREALSDLERRESAVADARSALETYREHRDGAAGADRRSDLTRTAAVAGLLAAGVAGAAGAIGGSPGAIALGVVLLAVAIGGGVAATLANRRLDAVETARERMLRAARDAGVDATTVEEVAPSLEAFDGKLVRARERVTRTEQALDDADGRLRTLREKRDDLDADVEEKAASLDGHLEAAGVESIAAFEETVAAREELEPERRTARQSLVDRFGEPDAEEPDEIADAWAEDLEGLVSDLDLDAVDAAAFDEATLDRLETEVSRLDRELDELESALEAHDDRLDAFDRRAREIDTRPFVDAEVTLDARTAGGLDALAVDLDAVVAAIERDAELSRKAIEVFERIEAREEQKLTDLFDPDGPASETFERLTDGRYTAVGYDAESHEIVVERRDGRTLTPDLLSNGTRDQLYFSSRVSLAAQLLGDEPGFFLLDDAFLAADPERLREGFGALADLAADGWQILYLTAKGEVRETVAEEFGIEPVEVG